jgi:hypothetical protein
MSAPKKPATAGFLHIGLVKKFGCIHTATGVKTKRRSKR